jgi:hypothetical protein
MNTGGMIQMCKCQAGTNSGMGLVNCPYCRNPYPPKEIEDHIEVCEQRFFIQA